jgi:hypothetical protein
MHSYHVYFDAKDGVSEEVLLAQISSFMEQQQRENRVSRFRVLRFTDKGSFKELPGFHLIVDYESDQELRDAFVQMKGSFQSEPHKSLMGMVANFKVAFSHDELGG